MILDLHRQGLSVSAIAVETHENWLEAHRYLNMNDLRELKRPPSAKPLNPSPHDRHLLNLTHRTCDAQAARACRLKN